MRGQRSVLVLSLVTAIACPPATAKVPAPSPTGNADIRALAAAAGGDYCDGQRQKPYVAAAKRYLTDLHGWLNEAIQDRLSHVNAVEGEANMARNRAADAQLLVDMQESLLSSANLLSSATDATKALTELSALLNPSPAMRSLMKSHPDQFETASLTDKLKAAKETLAQVRSTLGDFRSAMKNEQKGIEDTSIFTLRGKALAERMKGELPGEISSASDLYDALSKASDQLETINGIASVTTAENLQDLKTPVLAALTAIARYRQGQLMQEVTEMNALADEVDKVWVEAVKDARQLMAREAEVELALGRLSEKTLYNAQPCTQACSGVATGSPPDLPSGGVAFPSKGVTYGAALPRFDAATTAKFTNALKSRGLAYSPAQMGSLKLVEDRHFYNVGETIRYTVRVGYMCRAPNLTIERPNGDQTLSVPRDYSGLINGDVVGEYQLALRRTQPGKLMGVETFEVRKPHADAMPKTAAKPAATGAAKSASKSQQSACARDKGFAGAMENVACQDAHAH